MSSLHTMPADGFDAGFRRRCIREIPVTQNVHCSTIVVRKGRIYRASKERAEGRERVNWVLLEQGNNLFRLLLTIPFSGCGCWGKENWFRHFCYCV